MSISQENIFLMYATALGIGIAVVYDGLRILRRVIPHRRIFVSLEDLAFWFFCSAEVFLLMYRSSNGTLRWFAVLGAVAGIWIYERTLSPLLVRFCSFLLGKLCQGVGFVVCFLTKPFRKPCKYLKNKLKYSRRLIKINLGVSMRKRV